MTEPIRLVIWDLDETFWRGTISEGRIEYQQAVHDCVIELAKRGIVSSICSKNDFETVRAVLIAHDIWEYFIFPSINWEPKGRRVQSIIHLAQLRPPTVMLIDDNQLNLNEALYYVPGLQVAAETIIPTMLNNPVFRGKDDRNLSRLEHYKLLERRAADAAAAGGDNQDFLRASKIKVEIIPSVEANLDRAIELINRTNQLNFTKRRLPESLSEAQETLRNQINAHNVQAGLVRVSDRYGDYGFCGYYATQTGSLGTRLLDFCFSCRILNMGVEAWLYRRLGKPHLNVVGDVVTDIFRELGPLDWITERVAALGGAESLEAHRFARVILHGGCDLMPLAIYFQGHAREVIGEFNTLRDGVEIRNDHSSILRLAISAPGDDVITSLSRLGYRPDDLRTALTDHAVSRPVIILSFGMDPLLAVYRHKNLGFRAPFVLPISYPEGPSMDVTQLPRCALDGHLEATHWAANAVDELRENYIYEGATSESVFKENLTQVIHSLPPAARVFIVGQNETPRDGSVGQLRASAQSNHWVRGVIAGISNIAFINIRDFVLDELEVDSQHPGHFSRMVYFRLFTHILQRAVSWEGRD